MKNIITIFLTIFLAIHIVFVPASANFVFIKNGIHVASRFIDDSLKIAQKVSGKSIGPAARKTAAEQLRLASLRHGDDAIKAVRSGGLELMQAATRYGDDIWKYARAVPAGSRALALHPEKYLPLCRQFGDDILRIEAKAFSAAPKVAQHFGNDGVRYFANHVPPAIIPKLTGLAARAESPAVKKLLLKAYKDKGGKLFNRLNWKNILATGLSASMIIGTYQVSDGIQEGIATVSEKSPEQFRKIIYDMFSFFTTPVKIGFTLLILMLLYRYRVFFLKKRGNIDVRN